MSEMDPRAYATEEDILNMGSLDENLQKIKKTPAETGVNESEDSKETNELCRMKHI